MYRIVIPPRRNRAYFRKYNKALYRERHWVERFFNRVKQCRGLATRFEKIAKNSSRKYICSVFEFGYIEDRP
ncbi:MAG: transposase [Myxococcales bacterium]|nr:transposase [Myxococcales bacterium]